MNRITTRRVRERDRDALLRQVSANKDISAPWGDHVISVGDTVEYRGGVYTVIELDAEGDTVSPRLLSRHWTQVYGAKLDDIHPTNATA